MSMLKNLVLAVGLTVGACFVILFAWSILTGPILGFTCLMTYPVIMGHDSGMKCFLFTDCVMSLGRNCK
jgi:hypothetical protein